MFLVTNAFSNYVTHKVFSTSRNQSTERSIVYFSRIYECTGMLAFNKIHCMRIVNQVMIKKLFKDYEFHLLA